MVLLCGKLHDLKVGRAKKRVRGKVEFWTNCLLDQSDMPWYGQRPKYEKVDLEEEGVPSFRRDWGDVVGIDIREEINVRWLFQHLTPGVGIFDW